MAFALKKLMCLLSLTTLIITISSLNMADGAGECGKSSSPDNEAFKLLPCAMAAQDANSSVSGSCCAAVQRLGRNPKCLCAVIFSNTAKLSGTNPEIAMTIPKRCNLENRPVGYKCGPYTLP